MKILHVLYSGLGGHGNVFFSMVNADTKKEFEYRALFNGVEPVREEYAERCKETGIEWSYVKKKAGLHLGFYRQLYRQIREADPDHIILHGGIAMIPAWLAKLFSKKIKKILVRETQANHLKTKADWIRLSTAMLFADKMIYLSDEYREQVQQKLGWLYKKNRTIVIPNGIDLTVFTPLKKEPGTEIVLGMQSRLIDIKDHKTLFEAFAILKQQSLPGKIRLMVAGEGEYKKELMRIVEELNLPDDIVFTGMIEERALVSFLQGLDIYIHASLGETMSTAIMQAMACGKPIVASDVPGINNMIQDKVNGLLVPVQDPQKMAAALAELINDTGERGRLANAAFAYAKENFSNLTMFERYKKAMTG